MAGFRARSPQRRHTPGERFATALERAETAQLPHAALHTELPAVATPEVALAPVISLSARAALSARTTTDPESDPRSLDFLVVEAPNDAEPLLDAWADILSELIGPTGRYSLAPRTLEHAAPVFDETILHDVLRRISRAMDATAARPSSRHGLPQV